MGAPRPPYPFFSGCLCFMVLKLNSLNMEDNLPGMAGNKNRHAEIILS